MLHCSIFTMINAILVAYKYLKCKYYKNVIFSSKFWVKIMFFLVWLLRSIKLHLYNTIFNTNHQYHCWLMNCYLNTSGNLTCNVKYTNPFKWVYCFFCVRGNTLIFWINLWLFFAGHLPHSFLLLSWSSLQTCRWHWNRLWLNPTGDTLQFENVFQLKWQQCDKCLIKVWMSRWLFICLRYSLQHCAVVLFCCNFWMWIIMWNIC